MQLNTSALTDPYRHDKTRANDTQPTRAVKTMLFLLTAGAVVCLAPSTYAAISVDPTGVPDGGSTLALLAVALLGLAGFAFRKGSR